MDEEAKVYIVTSGEYSDYRINGVFSSREAAELFLSSVGVEGEPSVEIEEWPLDLSLSFLRDGWRVWHVIMTRDGGTDLAKEQSGLWAAAAAQRKSDWDLKSRLHAYVYARDREHAVKIVNERRTRAIAENHWPEAPSSARG